MNERDGLRWMMEIREQPEGLHYKQTLLSEDSLEIWRQLKVSGFYSPLHPNSISVYLIFKSWDSISWEMRAIFWDKLWCVGQIALRWQNVWFCDLNQHWYALNCVSGYIPVCVHIWQSRIERWKLQRIKHRRAGSDGQKPRNLHMIGISFTV